MDPSPTSQATAPEPLDMDALNAGLDHIRQAPADGGELKLIVRRPAEDQREVVEEAQLDTEVGLVGDNWQNVPSTRTEDGSAHPDMQLNIMNARVTELIAQSPDRWQLAGDQLYVDMDISTESLPHWTKLAIGDAIIQVTDQPHRGCAKFSARFGPAAARWVNIGEGVDLNLRGINAKVIKSGTIRQGDVLKRIED